MAQANPITLSGDRLDLSPRVFTTTTVVASPTLAAETIVGSVTITSTLALGTGVLLFAFVAFTVGTNGVSGTAQIRRTNAAGASIVSSGAVTATAANLTERQLIGLDASPTLPNQVYVVTLTVASASAGSTVSAVSLIAIVI